MSTIFAPVDQLNSVCYVSSGIREFANAEILEILKVARRKNAECGITGMLLYKGGNFLQVLEGPESSLIRVLDSISRDPRHRGMLLLSKQSISERNFGNWTMAFRDINDCPGDEVEGYSSFLEKSFLDEDFRSNSGRAFKLLLAFKKNMR